MICHVLHSLGVGGAEVLAAEYARRSRPEFEVMFACLDELGTLGERLREEGFQVEVLGRRPGFDLGCAWRLARVCRRHRVRLLHAHQHAPLFYSALSRTFRPGTPILFLEHGRDYPDYPRPKRKLAHRLLLRRRDRLVAVGDCVRQALIDNEGMPADRVEVVYNGVDLGKYDPSRPERRLVRQELGAKEDDFVVMQVARLNRLKDHPTAVRAFAHVLRRHPAALLAIVGDGEERPAVERLLDEHGIRDQVRLLGTRGDVPRLLQGADAFLLSSVTEGIALTLIEAMATGLPVVATDVGGNGEVVVAEETGLLAPAGDHEKLAERLLRLASDAQLRARLGAAGLERSRQFGADRMHERYQQMYRELLGVPARTPTSS